MDRRDRRRQRVVFAQARHTHLMQGDPLPDAAYDGGALPALLEAGWHISQTIAGSSGVYFVLTLGDEHHAPGTTT